MKLSAVSEIKTRRAPLSSRKRAKIRRIAFLYRHRIGIIARAHSQEVPDIADRNAQAAAFPRRAFARAVRVKHACRKDAQLELADAALHAQQQSIVRTTRIVHLSRSMTQAPTKPHSSRRWCQSRPSRERRDASRQSDRTDLAQCTGRSPVVRKPSQDGQQRRWRYVQGHRQCSSRH